MRVRQIPKNYRNVTGLVSSARLGRAVQFESSLERDFVLILDMLYSTVAHFEEQPIRLRWTAADGSEHSYVPDFLVFFSGGPFIRKASTRKPWLIEIKYRDDLKKQWRVNQPKFRAAAAEASRRGWAFHIVTEREIRTTLLSNAQLLRTYRKSVEDPQLVALTIAALLPLTAATVGQVVSGITSEAHMQTRLVETVWRLVATGRICADISSSLSTDTRIWTRNRGSQCEI